MKRPKDECVCCGGYVPEKAFSYRCDDCYEAECDWLNDPACRLTAAGNGCTYCGKGFPDPEDIVWADSDFVTTDPPDGDPYHVSCLPNQQED